MQIETGEIGISLKQSRGFVTLVNIKNVAHLLSYNNKDYSQLCF